MQTALVIGAAGFTGVHLVGGLLDRGLVHGPDRSSPGAEQSSGSPHPRDCGHSVAEVQTARETIGFEPAALVEEGLERMVEWLRKP